MLPMPGVQVQSLVEGLKSHMPCSMAKFFFFFLKELWYRCFRSEQGLLPVVSYKGHSMRQTPLSDVEEGGPGERM